MSSERNYSKSELYRIFNARQDFFFQLHHKRFEPHKEIILPDQSGALTIEQQDLNKRVLEVCDGFKVTSKRMEELDWSFDDYDVNQITAEMDEIGAMMQNLVRQVQELERIVTPHAFSSLCLPS